jgi:hypothetical protein
MDGNKIANWVAALVVLGIIGAIAYAALVPARQEGHRSSCISNMKQLGTGIQIYLGDYDDKLPPHGWDREIYPYTKNTGLTTCPAIEDRKLKYGYAMNREVMGKVGPTLPAQTPLFFEFDVFAPDVIASFNARSRNRHGKFSNVCYLDSRVKALQGNP